MSPTSSTTTTSQRPLKFSSWSPPATQGPRNCMTRRSVTTPSAERSSSLLFTQEREEPAGRRQAYHSPEESLLSSQSLSVCRSTTPLPQQLHWMVTITPTFAQSENSSSKAPWRSDMHFAIQQLSTQGLNPTTESKRAVKHLIRYLRGTQHTCLHPQPREMVQTGLLELVCRSDSDWAGDSAIRESVAGFHCDVQNVTMCNRSLKQTAISLSSCEAEFYAAGACA